MIHSSPQSEESCARAQAWRRRSTAALLLVGLAGCGAAPVETVSLTNNGLARGLVAHWRFDEPGGTTVGDTSGHGYNGVLASDQPGWLPSGGRFGGGLRLQKSESVTFMKFPDPTKDLTVSVWIKMSMLDRMAIADESRAVILSTERPSTGGWEIEFDPRLGYEYLEVSYFAGNSSGYPILPCRCIDIDRWMQFTAVFDGSNKRFYLYRDGRPWDSASMPQDILPGDVNLNIGQWMTGPRPISGVIDDFAIWMRALPPDEIAALNTRPAPDPL